MKQSEVIQEILKVINQPVKYLKNKNNYQVCKDWVNSQNDTLKRLLADFNHAERDIKADTSEEVTLDECVKMFKRFNSEF